MLVYLLCLYIDTQCDYTKLENITKCYKNNTTNLMQSNLQRNIIIVTYYHYESKSKLWQETTKSMLDVILNKTTNTITKL